MLFGILETPQLAWWDTVILIGLETQKSGRVLLEVAFSWETTSCLGLVENIIVYRFPQSR